ncbi:MAG: type II toxin-antitoxin system HicB family antitoxin [Dehalococcoidia bacterium]
MEPIRYNVFLEWDAEEEVWVTYVPSLNWLSTYGATQEEALEQTREAITGYLEAAAEQHLDLPRANANAKLATVEVAGP